MNFDKLAAMNCEDIKQTLIDVEGRVSALKTKVNNYVPEPYVPPVDPNRLPEIEFEGLNAGEIYQSVDRLTIKVFNNLTMYNTVLDAIFFSSNANTQVKIAAKIHGEITGADLAYKLRVNFNGSAILEQDRSAPLGAQVIEVSTLATSSADGGNWFNVQFLGTTGNQYIYISKIEFIVEGANVFFTSSYDDYQVNYFNDNYEITKVDENGNGYYQIINALTCTGIDDSAWLPTGINAAYQETCYILHKYGTEYYATNQYLLTHSYMGNATILHFWDNNRISTWSCSSVGENANYLAWVYFNSTYISAANAMYRINTSVTAIGRINFHKTTTGKNYNSSTKDWPIAKNIPVKTNYNVLIETNQYTTTIENYANGNVSSKFDASASIIGKNITAYFTNINKYNFNIFVNVFGKIVKYEITSTNGNTYTVSSGTELGNYKKYWPGVNNDYFVITHDNKLKYFKNP